MTAKCRHCNAPPQYGWFGICKDCGHRLNTEYYHKSASFNVRRAFWQKQLEVFKKQAHNARTLGNMPLLYSILSFIDLINPAVANKIRKEYYPQ